MPVMENEKHESFALGLAKGLPQIKAYTTAGYTANASAASRLAGTPEIKRRVEELKKERHQKFNEVMIAPDEDFEEGVKSLRDMGITIEWIANAYRNIYMDALDSGQYSAANSAVSNMQKLVEIEGAGTPNDDFEKESSIKLSEATALLDSVRGVIEASKSSTELPMVDITPNEPEPELIPTALLESLGETHDSNNS